MANISGPLVNERADQMALLPPFATPTPRSLLRFYTKIKYSTNKLNYNKMCENAWLPTVHRGSSDPNVLYLPFCHPHRELSPAALPVHLHRAGLFIALPGVAVIYRGAGLSPDKAQKMSHGVVQSSQMSFRLICKSHYQQFYWGSSDHFILLS